jgi:hypothetical protein
MAGLRGRYSHAQIGGGIQADVYVDTMSTFKVTGPVKDI